MTRTRAGHLFENVTAQKIYSHARSLGLRPNPPRHTLNYPTFSGGSYQFDASFSLGDVTYVIECKRTKMPAKGHIHYFNSQILDYLLGAKIRKQNLVMKGIFLSTVKVRESSMIYAIANGITVIDPVSPPLEYMVSTLKEGSVLSRYVTDIRKFLCSLFLIQQKHTFLGGTSRRVNRTDTITILIPVKTNGLNLFES